MAKPEIRWGYYLSGFFLLQTYGATGILDRLVYGDWDGKSGDKLTQALNVLLILASILLFCRKLGQLQSIRTGAILAVSLAAFLTLTAAWSIDPTTSARRGIQYLFFLIGAMGVAVNLEGDEFMGLLAKTCFLSAIASVALLAVSPGAAMMPDGLALRGIFSHKSVTGQIMAAGVLASLHGLRTSPRQRSLNVIMLATCIVVAVAAKSATTMMVIAAFCCTDTIATLLRRGGGARVLGLGLLAVLVPIIAVIVCFPDLVLEAAGKDPTLTGRTFLWQYVEQEIAQRPFLGWGLMAFWSTSNPLANAISTTLGWVVPHSHNDILEMLLEVGFAGTLIFILFYVRNLVLAVRCMGGAAPDLGQSTMLNCIGLALVGITEDVLVDPSQISTVILFVTAFLCERMLRRSRVLTRGIAILHQRRTPAVAFGPS